MEQQRDYAHNPQNTSQYNLTLRRRLKEKHQGTRAKPCHGLYLVHKYKYSDIEDLT